MAFDKDAAAPEGAFEFLEPLFGARGDLDFEHGLPVHARPSDSPGFHVVPDRLEKRIARRSDRKTGTGIDVDADGTA